MKRLSIRLGRLRRVLRCERGATAVEFAMLAVPTVGLVLAMLQTALVFFAGQVLQNATNQAGRLIMTGQAIGMSAGQFQQAVCDRGSGYFDCTKLSVNVQTFTSFSGMTGVNPVSGGKINTAALNFQPGVPGTIEIVQAYYPWPVGADLLGISLANVNGNAHLLMATSVFRNEPY